ESVLRRELRESLAQLWPELELIGEAGTGIEAVRLLERRIPDVLFLDIQMPGMSGLDVARHVQGRCHVVFVTAYAAYAVAAFRAGRAARDSDRAREATAGNRAGAARRAAADPVAGPRRPQLPEVDQRDDRPEHAGDHDRRGRLLPGRHQVHASGDQRR